MCDSKGVKMHAVHTLVCSRLLPPPFPEVCAEVILIVCLHNKSSLPLFPLYNIAEKVSSPPVCPVHAKKGEGLPTGRLLCDGRLFKTTLKVALPCNNGVVQIVP